MESAIQAAAKPRSTTDQRDQRQARRLEGLRGVRKIGRGRSRGLVAEFLEALGGGLGLRALLGFDENMGSRHPVGDADIGRGPHLLEGLAPGGLERPDLGSEQGQARSQRREIAANFDVEGVQPIAGLGDHGIVGQGQRACHLQTRVEDRSHDALDRLARRERVEPRRLQAVLQRLQCRDQRGHRLFRPLDAVFGRRDVRLLPGRQGRVRHGLQFGEHGLEIGEGLALRGRHAT